ncbi:Lysosomal acid phosphatase [Phytophthora ramorum]|uniref:Lysosomal acid phosphatase n=1 Tax=Phytophthora ramorum TaxID=164328 RepID=UPI003096E495|nr:Lysosomal acid phosphatase [Phytophthora ramorum]
MVRMASALLLAVLASGAAVSAEEAAPSELRRLVTLSRHGSRAPNDIVKDACPRNKANLDAYKVPLTQLTEVGMKQLQAVGEHVRHTYMVDESQHEEAFLSRSLNGINHSHFETYFRADAATRCSQSATAVGYGLYPDGTGPRGFPHQPVPITMQLVENEHAFAAPKGPCKSTMDADLAVYAETRAPELFEQYRDILDQLGEVCGVAVKDIPNVPGGEDVVLGVKDLADMFIFDHDEGLPLPEGMTVEARQKLEQLAFTNLMERYYSTDREITYWVGGFGDLLMSTLQGGAVPMAPSPAEYRYYSFHGHRELLHGLGMMLGWEFHFEGLPTALNVSALHPGTTMFFELRARTLSGKEAQETYFVRTYMWSPFTEREQVKLTKCSVADCPLDEFNSIITGHIARTGTWEAICDYHKPVLGHNQAALAQGSIVEGSHGFARCSFLTVIGIAMVVGLAFTAFKVYSARRRGYTMVV